MTEHTLAVKGLSKVFPTEGGPVVAVDDVSFELAGNEFFTMLGPSGCGKTTTLRMIAGLESCSSGTILFDRQDFTRFSAFRRNIGMVFQSYALFPHMTVFENAAYGLRVRKAPRSTIDGKLATILRLLGLQDLAGRYPSDLSGGQQQRVSIARALVYDPGMLLLDEPLANLDAKLRVEMREEIRRIQKELGIMTLYVTHDQEEAMSVSDRLGVFSQGKLMQAGKPEDIYANPASLFVADFIGKANFFPARVAQKDASGARIVLDGGRSLTVSRLHELSPVEAEQVPAGFDGLVMVRPEHVQIAPADDGHLACEVRRIQFLGSFVRYVVACKGATREAHVDSTRVVPTVTEGGAASLGLSSGDAHFFHRRADA